MMEVNLLLAFVAGVLGFLSPCIVPLVPGYASFVSGISLGELDPASRRRHLAQVLVTTGLFVFGFSIVFTAMGASASALGAFVMSNRQWLGRVGGLGVVLVFLVIMGGAMMFDLA